MEVRTPIAKQLAGNTTIDITQREGSAETRALSFCAYFSLCFMEVKLMANKVIAVKVGIDSDKLRQILRSKNISIRKIGRDGVYSEKTIRRGIKNGELTVDVVSYLALYLKVAPGSFADIDRYFENLHISITNWKES